MSTDLRVAAGRQWITPMVFGVLGLELAAIVVFAATYNALDFRIYMWGGHAMLRDGQLYLTQGYGHWFTYSPFAALVYWPGTGRRGSRWPPWSPPRSFSNRCGRPCSSARST